MADSEDQVESESLYSRLLCEIGSLANFVCTYCKCLDHR
jgi:hypothetical protein